jgi:hypothetical protein
VSALALPSRHRGRQSAAAAVLDDETKAPPGKNSAPVRLPVQLDLPFDLPPRGPRQCSSAKAGCQNRQNYKCVGRNIRQARSAGLFDWDSNRTSSPEGAFRVTKHSDEIWLPIPRYEGFYSISNLGRVRTEARTYVSKNGITKPVRARFLKCGATGKGGYPRFSVSVNDVSRVLYVHQSVMLAFVGLPPDRQEVLHNDGDPQNCRLDNLRYGTRAQNIDDAKRHGTFPMHENRPGAVLTKDQAREIAGSSESANALAARFGITKAVVYQVWRGDTWSDVTKDIQRITYRKRACKKSGPRKLREEQVAEIFKSSDFPRSLARRFNVSKQLIWAIKRGRIWKHITAANDYASIHPRRQ